MNHLSLENPLPKDLSFAGETYLVTGAANGIGRALALALSKLEATVILLDKNDTKLNSVYDEINKSSKVEPVIVHQDLTQLDQDHCNALTEQIEKTFGKINGLIHCAAETGHLAPFDHYSENDWSKVMSANLYSPYLLTRCLLPLFSADDSSVVIFSVSEQARKSSAFWGAFAVAQQGLKALVETWSEETQNSNTNFIMLDPGKVNTEFLIQLFPGLNAQNHPNAEVIARAYVYLLTNNKKNLHGKFVQVKDLKLEIVS